MWIIQDAKSGQYVAKRSPRLTKHGNVSAEFCTNIKDARIYTSREVVKTSLKMLKLINIDAVIFEVGTIKIRLI